MPRLQHAAHTLLPHDDSANDAFVPPNFFCRTVDFSVARTPVVAFNPDVVTAAYSVCDAFTVLIGCLPAYRTAFFGDHQLPLFCRPATRHVATVTPHERAALPRYAADACTLDSAAPQHALASWRLMVYLLRVRTLVGQARLVTRTLPLLP